MDNHYDLVMEWYSVTKAEHYSHFTALNYKTRLTKHFLPWLGDRDLKTLKSSDIWSFRQYLLVDRKLNIRLVNNIIVALKSFWNFIVQKDMVANIMPSSGLSIKEPYSLPQPIAENDIAAIFKAIQTRDHEMKFILLMSFFSGLRIGEILKLTKDDFSVENKMIKVHVREGKGGKERFSLLLPYLNVYRMVLGYLKKFAKNEIIVKSSRYSVLHRAKRISERSRVKTTEGNPFTIHKGRHTYATMLIDKMDIDENEVAELMGHSDTKTTKRYGRRSLSNIAVNVWEKFKIKDQKKK